MPNLPPSLSGPALDQPQTIEHDGNLSEAVRFRLANQDLVFDADVHANLHNLFWPWADEYYARSIRVWVSAPREDEFVPLVTRLFPGRQEVIYGSEGIIVSKQLSAPMDGTYDRSALWIFECQAEGDRLLRIDVEVDWGEPLTQRMVDGLLVAQRNPRAAQGIYQQQNAESTRVLGNPQSRPSSVEIDDQRAHLAYYVLVNGVVEVPLLLTVSDVGEQMAWNGFLSIRDGDKVLEKSNTAWAQTLQTGRLWTPDALLNHAIQTGRIHALYCVQRLRTGFASTTRDVQETRALVNCFDLFDPLQSRNLLAHLRRLAERTTGRLPAMLPVHPKDPIDDPGGRLIYANAAYLTALHDHMQHHFDAALLAEHYPAVGLCATVLAQLSQALGAELAANDGGPMAADALALAWHSALACGVRLARWHGDAINAAAWAAAVDAASTPPHKLSSILDWTNSTSWQAGDNGVWSFAHPLDGIALAGLTIWQGCGVVRQGEQIVVTPQWPPVWNWWALLNVPKFAGPKSDERFSLVWDGTVLHATEPVQSELPVKLHKSIRTRGSDEMDFNLYFEFMDEPSEGQVVETTPALRKPAEIKSVFRPAFL
ncbi:MAG: hypothetical protein R3A44_05590 [Caldilineaceae bacterium]